MIQESKYNIQDRYKNKLIKDEGILQIDGTLFNVQEAISNIIKKVTQYFRNNEFDIRIVMPVNFAQTNRDKGSVENKQEATILILEQIEWFKNGGPILESGKTLFNNIKYSVDLRYEAVEVLQKNQLSRHQSSSLNSDRRQRSRSSNKRQKCLRRSKLSRSNWPQSKQQLLKTKIIVELSLIELMNKQLLRFYYYKIDKQDIRDEASGDIKGCISVVQYILSEQCKLLKG